MKSRLKVIAALTLLAAFFLLLFSLNGRTRTWQLCCVPALPITFYDTFALMRATELFAAGGDPLILDPASTTQIPINYPALNWRILHFMGLNSSHTAGVAAAFILSFLTGVALLLPNVKTQTLAAVLLALASPATLLCVERANLDLFLFFLVALSVSSVRKLPPVSTLLFLFGFLLKLFPAFGFAALLRLEPKKFFRHFAFLALSAALALAATFPEIKKILANTPQGINGSYGYRVFAMGLESVAPSYGSLAKVAVTLLLLLVLAFAAQALFKEKASGAPFSESLNLDAFRAGACIFVCTFFLGTNFDYKFIFLILALPQLMCWAQCPSKRLAAMARVTLAALFVSLYYWTFMLRLAPVLPFGKSIVFAVDECVNWGLFALLFHLLVWSCPDWAKALLPFGKGARSGAAAPVSDS